MKTIKVAANILFGFIIGMVVMYMALKRILKPLIQKKNEQHLKDKAFYDLLVEWLSIRHSNKVLTYFKKRDYNTIAVYGMKELGELLCSELNESGICIRYAIDKNADTIWSDVHVLKPEDELPEVDVIVVTAITSFEIIKEFLEKKVKCPIVSLEDVIFD